MKLIPGQIFNEHYEIIDTKFGAGGNGDVVLARDTRDCSEVVIKFLQERHLQRKDRVQRFIYEIEALRELAGMPGIIPIKESQNEYPHFWFVMPRAVPFSKYVEEKEKDEIVTLYIQIAEALSDIHSRGRAHRDIKPDNLFVLDGNAMIGDFGLVKNPHAEEAITKNFEKLGPTFFIAPEMLNNVTEYEGFEADVFSLAKSLWVSLTNSKYPIPGQHDLAYGPYMLEHLLQKKELGFLDYLINRSTTTDPGGRISMQDFSKQLKFFLNMQKKDIEFDLENIAAQLGPILHNDNESRTVQTKISTETLALARTVFDELAPKIKQLRDGFLDSSGNIPLNAPSWATDVSFLNDSMQEIANTHASSIVQMSNCNLSIWIGSSTNKRFRSGIGFCGFLDKQLLLYCGFSMSGIGEKLKPFEEKHFFVPLLSAEREVKIEVLKEHFLTHLNGALKDFIHFCSE